MPGYPGNDLAQLLYENRQGMMFFEEAVRAGERSVAFQLRRVRGVFHQPFAASFQLTFSGNPGAFEIDIEAADTDEDANYVTVAKLTSVTPTFAARADMTDLWPVFVRGAVVAMTNPVNATLMVSLAGQGPAPAGSNGGGGMVYPPAGVAVSTGSAWGNSIDPTTLATTAMLSQIVQVADEATAVAQSTANPNNFYFWV